MPTRRTKAPDAAHAADLNVAPGASVALGDPDTLAAIRTLDEIIADIGEATAQREALLVQQQARWSDMLVLIKRAAEQGNEPACKALYAAALAMQVSHAGQLASAQ